MGWTRGRTVGSGLWVWEDRPDHDSAPGAPQDPSSPTLERATVTCNTAVERIWLAHARVQGEEMGLVNPCQKEYDARLKWGGCVKTNSETATIEDKSGGYQ